MSDNRTMRNLLLIVLSLSTFANDDIAQCGATPNFLTDLFTNASHVREICLETIKQENKKKKAAELAQIQNTLKEVDKRLDEVAYSNSETRVYCEPRSSNQDPDQERTKKCRELLASKNALIARMDYLMGWDRRLARAPEKLSAQDIQLDCPSTDELKKIRAVRYFNRNLYQSWEKCVTLRADDFSI